MDLSRRASHLASHPEGCGCPAHRRVTFKTRSVDDAALRAPVSSLIGEWADVAEKADPYGRGVPSPLPAPNAPRRGEPIPKPGLPPGGVPHYLKPIPVNTRNVRNILEGYVRTGEPRVIRFLYSTWNASADPLKYQELRNAMKTGELTGSLMEAWRQEYSEMIALRMRPMWDAVAIGSHGSLQAGLVQAAGRGIPYETLAARMSPWIRQRGAELAVNLTDAQGEALRTLLQRYVIEEPIGAKELARYIRPVCGLTPGQTEAVMRYRTALYNEGLDPDKVTHRVENYAARLNRQRAERIARTEISFAFNKAQLSTMEAVQDDGVGKVSKILLTARNDRVCEWCSPYDGEVIGLEDTWPGATSRLPTVNSPPLHPNCLCAVLWQIEP